MRNTFVNRVTFRTNTQTVIPDIQFTCNGTITKWIIGGMVGKEREMNSLELQTWRSNASYGVTLVRKISSFVNKFNATSDRNVYEYIPNPPIEVQEGDILGIFQPKQSVLTMYVQAQGGPLNYGTSNTASSSLIVTVTENSLLNQIDYPLVSAVISTSPIVLSRMHVCELQVHLYVFVCMHLCRYQIINKYRWKS